MSQKIGSKVMLLADDGKTYSGTIKAIQGKKYKVKYDLSKSEVWLYSNQFIVTKKGIAPPETTNTTPQKAADKINNNPPEKSPGSKPTAEDITAALKASWERPQTTNQPKQTVTIHDIKMRSSEIANLKHQYDGIPKETIVTNAKIDFTQYMFYSNETQHTRRIMTAWVFKDQFGEWKIMNVGVVYPDK
jgi:hypothetical protein